MQKKEKPRGFLQGAWVVNAEGVSVSGHLHIAQWNQNLYPTPNDKTEDVILVVANAVVTSL